MRSSALAAGVLAGALVAACGGRPRPELPSAPTSFTLAGSYLFPAGPRQSTMPGIRFGGLSGLAALPGGRDFLGISDDRENSRMFRFSVVGSPPLVYVVARGAIRLQGAPVTLDPEGIVLLPNGNVLVSSEGIGEEEPRIPPSINEFTPEGTFVRQLPVSRRFVPNERGPLATGVRVNSGFEALTLTPDGEQLFTANEVPLVQDGPDDPFAAGQRIRLVEYTRQADDSYQPARELVYELSPMPRPPFEAGFAVNGLVELLAVSDTELLALERGFAQSKDRQQGVNVIRIFRLSLAGATDVAGAASLAAAGDAVAVRKTLAADLGAMPGLPPELRNLDNFEALAWLQGIGDGPRHLIVASDDNFSDRQLTAFLVLGPGVVRQ